MPCEPCVCAGVRVCVRACVRAYACVCVRALCRCYSRFLIGDGRGRGFGEVQQVHEIMGSSEDLLGKEVLVKGWCRTVRDQKAFSFIELNDGSLPSGIQVSLSAPWRSLRHMPLTCALDLCPAGPGRMSREYISGLSRVVSW